MSNSSTPPPPAHGRWYFARRAFAAASDYAIYGGLYFAYVRFFGVETDEGYKVEGCLHLVALVLAWFGLLPLPEGLFGRTFGKWVCDLRVVNLSGGPATFGQAVRRRVLDPIDLLSFFGVVAFIVAKNNPMSQRLGDLVAKTRVVEDVQPPEAVA
jgi:uncharacterized RDD family membrane protein YckC